MSVAVVLFMLSVAGGAQSQDAENAADLKKRDEYCRRFRPAEACVRQIDTFAKPDQAGKPVDLDDVSFGSNGVRPPAAGNGGAGSVNKPVKIVEQPRRREVPRCHASESTPVSPGDLTIAFDNASASLTCTAQGNLLAFASAMRGSNMRFRIVGHTSIQGTAEYNEKLSNDRARAVVNFLVRHGKMPASRLEAEGRGFREHLPNMTGAEDANRRVEAEVLSN